MNKYLSTLLCAVSFLSPCAGVAEEQEPFSLKLFRETVRQTPGNVAFSPSSLEGVLRMLQLGARGTTADELEQSGLTFAPPLSAVRLHEAEALFVDNALEPELKADARRHDIITIPMTTSPETAAARVNSWVRSRTRGMIPELVNPSSFSGASPAVMLAVNAVAFEEKWAVPFDPAETETCTFHCADGSEADVQMMIQHSRLTAAQGLDWQAVALYYRNQPLSGDNTCLVAVLPRGNARDFASGLTAGRFSEICHALKHATPFKFQLGLPRFELLTGSQSFKAVLEACGLRSMFTGQADFSGFADAPLYVSDVRQNCFVQVAEQGTRAAAATGAVTVWLSIPQELPEHIIFDRPFIWFIVNLDAPETPYFMGLYDHP